MVTLVELVETNRLRQAQVTFPPKCETRLPLLNSPADALFVAEVEIVTTMVADE